MFTAFVPKIGIFMPLIKGYTDDYRLRRASGLLLIDPDSTLYVTILAWPTKRYDPAPQDRFIACCHAPHARPAPSRLLHSLLAMCLDA